MKIKMSSPRFKKIFSNGLAGELFKKSFILEAHSKKKEIS